MRNNNIAVLSYGVDEKTPLYPGTPGVEIEKVKRISKGDSSNTHVVKLSGHCGTHLDAPRHFFEEGSSLAQIVDGGIVCGNVAIIDCPKGPHEMIEARDIRDGVKDKGIDALLVRTGFYKLRLKQPEKYCNENPGLSPEAAVWIRENLHSLKVFGVDVISISQKHVKGPGAKAHRSLMTNEGYRGGPVYIVEDMYLPQELNKLNFLHIIPLLKADVDSSPCTVIGLTDE